MEKVIHELREIKESQIRMEVNIKHHIKRTDLLEIKLEKQLDPIHRAFSGAKWALSSLLTLGGISYALMKIAELV